MQCGVAAPIRTLMSLRTADVEVKLTLIETNTSTTYWLEYASETNIGEDDPTKPWALVS